MPRMIGVQNIVTTKDDWFYLCFYDIDRPITQAEIDGIDYLSNKSHISYLLYRTKHGTHYIGLTPLTAIDWALIFTELKNMFKGYYSGKVIRLSRKPDEEQILLVKNTQYGEVIPNLYNLWATRFNYNKLAWNMITGKYVLVFEKYRSMNE